MGFCIAADLGHHGRIHSHGRASESSGVEKLSPLPRIAANQACIGLTLPVVACLLVVLGCDSFASQTQQFALGALTWLVLFALLARESPLVRIQTFIVIAFATGIEYTFSYTFGVYDYRFDNVPPYVPPGHGLVYLAALGISRSAFVREHAKRSIAATVVAGGCYSAWGVFISGRPDALGAFWFLCLLAFMIWGKSQLLYVGAFVMVTFLELLGTQLGVWTWSAEFGPATIGNPPSGAAGGYAWFDLAAVVAGPVVLRTCTWAGSRQLDWRRIWILPSVAVTRMKITGWSARTTTPAAATLVPAPVMAEETAQVSG